MLESTVAKEVAAMFIDLRALFEERVNTAKSGEVDHIEPRAADFVGSKDDIEESDIAFYARIGLEMVFSKF